MTLNKPSGNMYPWAYTWNPLGGKCRHACPYCYVEKLRQRGLKKYFGEVYLDEKAFKDSLNVPSGFVVFVQSCGDLLGDWVPTDIVERVFDYIEQFPKTIFLLQTKNPRRYSDFFFAT